ncbi:hypothetical protein [Leptospira noguchii]|uniref:hypothetical protein n=1 Tax=Leptospira noguchii TaxID=28182 RepID=UPI0003284324|nr:hypothetical protein [Leptospira noguchii]EMS84700.1 hypothetical protein LEP1GSC073_1775 [Leptospira noguchii str. Cascata]
MEQNIEISDLASNEFKKPKLDNNIHLLPQNWSSDIKTEYEFSENTITVKKLLATNDLQVTIDGFSEESPIISNRNYEWMGPVIFISYSLLSQNEYILSIALNIISNYLTDIFKGLGDNNKVDLKIYKENEDGSIKKISYKGPASGLEKLKDILKSFNK